MVRYVILGAKLVNIIQNSKSQNQNYRAKPNNASSYPCKRNVVKMQTYSVTMANDTLYDWHRHTLCLEFTHVMFCDKFRFITNHSYSITTNKRCITTNKR